MKGIRSGWVGAGSYQAPLSGLSRGPVSSVCGPQRRVQDGQTAMLAR